MIHRNYPYATYQNHFKTGQYFTCKATFCKAQPYGFSYKVYQLPTHEVTIYSLVLIDKMGIVHN